MFLGCAPAAGGGSLTATEPATDLRDAASRSRPATEATWRRGVAVLLLVSAASLAGCAHFVVLHDPLTASEHNDLGVVYEAAGHLDLAAGEYRRALKLDSRQTRARVNLGNVEAARGRWRHAEKHYRRALADSTTNLDAMNNLAIALLRQERGLEEAQALAERAVAGGAEPDSIHRATLAEIQSARRRRR